MIRRRLAFAAVMLLVVLASRVGIADDDPPRPPALGTIAVPESPNLDEFVRDRAAAIVLGKALFWDMQVGSDGIQACATCHFNAGADSRSRHQLNPGERRAHTDGSAAPDSTLDSGLNHQLTAADFPLSPASNDVVGSQGIVDAFFRGVSGRGADLLTRSRIAPVRIGRAALRQVESRNAPTVVNAVFNDRNFWDGRAASVFNGVNERGDADPGAIVLRADPTGRPAPVHVRLERASLASQAVAPAVSTTEMAARGRRFADLGAKLAPRRRLDGPANGVRPLARQRVHPDDGVLGPYSRWPRPGLTVRSYEDLIAAAFRPEWWRADRTVRIRSDGTIDVSGVMDRDDASSEYTLVQHNFALFFGLAIQLYEATLVADDTPYDRFMRGDGRAISEAAVHGVDLFRSQTRGRCINCHEGAELTGASVRRVAESPVRIRERQALDRGFNNIGVLPTEEDLGVGGADAFGVPLSTVRRLASPPLEPLAVDGAMKVPGLRNVELTAPYFHNGGLLTLHDVLTFYSRGGDTRPQHTLGGAVEIAPLNVLDNDTYELAALEAFLLSLTDERVRLRQAPFDHPQLFVPNGALGDEHAVLADHRGDARDVMIEIPAVGRHGGAALPRFLEPW